MSQFRALPLELPIFAADLMAMLGYQHTDTLRRAIKDGRVPAPDVRLSQKTRYWHRATLERAGLIPGPAAPAEKASPPSPAASGGVAA